MSKLNKIYTGDYSEEGYIAGINSSEKNKPKNKLGVIKSIHPINYAWQFSNAYKSYMRSYDKGYIDGQRKQNDVHYKNSSKGEKMQSANQSFALQLQILQEFERNLCTLKEYLAVIPENYGQQIAASASLGFVDDYVNGLTKRQRDFANKISQTMSLIEQQRSRINELHKSEINRLRQLAQQ
tara:strand:+ start:989 stop:1534 length:546 start_codon:yes stop_codon:yes gene_type:complete